nr:class I mannose-6-phosphate isomerase [Novosphingobium hassiacum]
MVEKPWGVDTLPPPFVAPEGKRIGEVWFEPPPEMPDILVKYIFTSEKLSVQVHPSDEQAKELGESGRGKEECWLVIDAEPGATLGIGFKRPIDAEAMRAAALDGSIEDLMEWYPVKVGDFFYIPAGTVHAIGAGVSLIEIQQNSDITYRLYDYGRPRELHLDKGIAVARGQALDQKWYRTVSFDQTAELVDGPFFILDLVRGIPEPEIRARHRGVCLIIPLASGGATQAIGLQPDVCEVADLSLFAFAESGLHLVVSRPS